VTADRSIDRRTRQFRSGFAGAALVVLVCLVIAAALLHRGWDFYQLGLDARIDHPDFRVLSPGEIVGHGYGIVGTALILTNLLYILRRRVARLSLGSMRAWLNLHAATGLVGSVLIVFHSAFQLRTPIAMLTSGALAFVVFTGVIGRYLYALSPAFDPEPLHDNLKALDGLASGAGSNIRTWLEARPVTNLGGSASLPRALLTIPVWLHEARTRRRHILNHARVVDSRSSLTAEELLVLERSVRECAAMAAGEVRAMAGATLLRSWRTLHRVLALIMIASVSVHIAVAWIYGYRWLWSE